ncbi:MAG: MBL fold metallo-hydrolase [Calditrichaeota bacterium]|nr:MBL fold metallo-hydrolase [Spirochaetales bacterium]RQW04861.1 MAG: MBL fold metallo-hydrolase [Calditrichota bacterium]
MQNEKKSGRMKMKFIGAVETVTGSCTMLEYESGGTTRFLVDCGMHQGEEGQSFSGFSFDPSAIHSVFLTHAHLDHCGLIPLLYKNGFKGKVYCTSATADASREILIDGARVSRLYEVSDVDHINYKKVDHDSDFKWGKSIPVARDVFFYFLRSSHILGAVSVGLTWIDEEEKRKTITFSGDLGATDSKNSQSLLLKDNQYPFNGDGNDFIVLESTYGGSRKKVRKAGERLDRLYEIISDFFSDGTQQTLIIPSFSLHRSQEILFDLFVLFSTREFTARYPEEYIRELIGKEDSFPAQLVESIPGYKRHFEPSTNNRYRIKPEINKDSLYEYLVPREWGYNCQVSVFSNLIEKLMPVYKEGLKNFRSVDGEDKYFYANSILETNADFLGFEDLPSLIDQVFSLGERCEQKGKIRKKNFRAGNAFFNSIDKYKINKNRYLFEKRIIISSSGMCDNGKVVELLKHHLQDKNTMILLTGYQAGNTNGYLLNNLEHYSPDEKRNRRLNDIDLRLSDVKCKVENISEYYSGHAGADSLLRYIFGNPDQPRTEPIQVFLNHGTNRSRKELAGKIDEINKSLDPTAPETILPMREHCNKWFDMHERMWEVPSNTIVDKMSPISAGLIMDFKNGTVQFPPGTDMKYIAQVSEIFKANFEKLGA